jgi:hypothetical protein
VSDPRAAHAQSGIAPPLKLFITIQLVLLLACDLTELFCRTVLHLKEPYDYPYLSTQQSFWDFMTFAIKSHYFHSPAFFTADPKFPFLYPAPSAVFYQAFFLFGPLSLLLFLTFLVLTFVVAALLLHRAMRQRGVSALQAAAFLAFTLLLSYPMWIDFKQGNIEIGVWLFVVLGVWAFCVKRGYCAAACFGIAGAMKIYPFLYLGLLLARRKYREIAFAGAVAFLATLASLWLLGGNDISGTWRHILAGVGTFRAQYVLQFRPNEIGFDHSLFALIKCCVLLFNPAMQQYPPQLFKTYVVVGTLAGILINQVLCLCIASILLPPVSYDYTLMHLYIPWAMLVLFAQEQWGNRRTIAGLTVALVLLAFLFAPESEFICQSVRFGGQLKAIALIALMVVSLKYPFSSSPASRMPASLDQPAFSTTSSQNQPMGEL